MITMDPEKTLPPLRMPFKRGIAVGRAYELFDFRLQQHLRRLQQDIGFGYCRFHALFDDDMKVVTRDENGRLHFCFTNIDFIYDFLLEIGLRPFVELNPMPAALAGGEQTMFAYRMNVTPPRDDSEWEQLVYAFCVHVTDRYGQDEVRRWHFEVWNEPDLSGFWSGTQQQYFELYRRSAQAVKRVCADYRVGGPATSKGNWLADFIAFCHQQEVALDFVSTHFYPQDEFVRYETQADSPYAPGSWLTAQFAEARRVIDASPLPGLPLHCTEWNTQHSSCRADITWGHNPYVDNLYGGAFCVRNCLALDDACDSMAYWVASDVFGEGGIPNTPFSSRYGLLTIHGLKKPNCHAFELLSCMEGERVALSGAFPDGCGAVCCKTQDGLRLLIYNNPAVNGVWSDFTDTVVFGGSYQGITRRLCADGGSAYEHWLAMGSPAQLTRAQLDYLRAKAELKTDRGVFDGEFSFSLAPCEVLYAELTRQSSAARSDDLGFLGVITQNNR